MPPRGFEHYSKVDCSQLKVSATHFHHWTGSCLERLIEDELYLDDPTLPPQFA